MLQDIVGLQHSLSTEVNSLVSPLYSIKIYNLFVVAIATYLKPMVSSKWWAPTYPNNRQLVENSTCVVDIP